MDDSADYCVGSQGRSLCSSVTSPGTSFLILLWLCVGSLCPCPYPVLATTIQSLSVFVFGQDVFGRIQAFCGKSNHCHSSFSFAFTPDEALWKFNPSANLRGQGPLPSLEDVRQVSGKGKCSGSLHWSRSGGSSWKSSVYRLLTVCSLYSDHFVMGLK